MVGRSGAAGGARSTGTRRCDLAAVLGVSTNTVLRALRLLRDEGLLEFRRGRGITVSGGAVARSIVLDKANDLVEVARSQGFRRDELLRLIEGLA